MKEIAQFLMRNEGFRSEAYLSLEAAETWVNGYGNTGKVGEPKPADIDEQQGRIDLRDNMLTAAASSRSYVGAGPYDELDTLRQGMLLHDPFSIKGGNRAAPDFAKAVMDGDAEGMLAHYKRHYTNAAGEKVELTKRNADFKRSLIDPWIAQYGKGKPRGTMQESNPHPPPPPVPEGVPEKRALKAIFDDPQFRMLSPRDRSKYLAENNERFSELRDSKPELAEEWITQSIVGLEYDLSDDPDFVESVMAGWDISLAASQKLVANTVMLIEKSGIIETDLDDTWSKQADRRMQEGMEGVGEDWYDVVGAVLGGLPVGLATAAGFVAAAGALPGVGATAAPILGFGALGALGAADQGPEAAAKAFAVEGAIGALFGLTRHATRLARGGIIGTASLVAHGGPQTQMDITGAAVMGGLAAMPGARPPMKVWKKATKRWQEDHPDVPIPHQAGVEIEANERVNKAMADNLDQTPNGIDGPWGEAALKLLKPGEKMEDVPFREMLDRQDKMRDAGEVASMPKSEWTPEELRTYEFRLSVEHTNPSYIGKMRGDYDPGPANRAMPMKPFPDQGEFIPGRKGAARKTHILRRLAKDFEVPFGNGPKSKKESMGALGLYRYAGSKFDRLPENERNFGRQIWTKSRQNIQTDAHEFAHDLTFQWEGLNALHRGPEFSADWNRMRGLVYEGKQAPVNVKVNEKTGAETHTDLMYLDDMIAARKAGKVPEDLLWMEEALSISYDKGNFTEGVAEFGRVWMTQDAAEISSIRNIGRAKDRPAENWGSDLAGELGHLKAKWEEAIEAMPKKQRKALYRAKSEFTDYIDQGGQAVASTLAERGVSTVDVLNESRWWGRSALIDRFSVIEKLAIMGSKDGRLPEDSIFHAFQLTSGIGAMNQAMLRHGFPVVVKDTLNPHRPDMIEFKGPGILDNLAGVSLSRRSLKRYLRWQRAVQTEETSRQFFEKDTGEFIEFTKEEMKLDSVKKTIEKAVASGRFEAREKLYTRENIEQELRLSEGHPEYDVAYAKMKDFASGVADFAQANGLFNASQRASWRRAEFIHSFLRQGFEGSGGKGVGARVIHQLRGSSRLMRNDLEAMTMTYSNLIQAAIHNKVTLRLFDELKVMEGGGRYATIAKKITIPHDYSIKQVQEGLIKELTSKSEFPEAQSRKMIEDSFGTMPELERITMFQGKHPEGEGIFRVFRDGNLEFYHVSDPVLIRGIQALRSPELMGLEKYWNYARKLKTTFITIAPGFMTANFGRDTIMASVMSKTGNFHLWKALGGLKSAFKEDVHYKEYVANFGGGSSMNEFSAQSMSKALIRNSRRVNLDPRALIITPGDLWRFMKKLGEAVEMANRLGEHKAARKQGHSAGQSGYMGKEVSTDFTRHGDLGTMRVLGHIVPFFNAMVAGGDRTYRAVARDPTHRLATGVKMMMVGAFSGALYEINRRIPEYSEFPEWLTLSNWMIPLPSYSDDGKTRLKRDDGELKYDWSRIPRAFEAGSVGSLVELFMKSMYESDDLEVVELVQDLGQVLAMNIGLNLSDQGYPLPLPVGVYSLVEQIRNKNLHTDATIESAEMINMLAFQRRRAKTPKVLSALAEMLRDVPAAPDVLKSPVRAEALLRGLFSELAAIGLSIADSVLYPGGPAMHPSDFPGFSRWYQQSGKYSKIEQEFFARFHEFSQVQKSIDNLMEAGSWKLYEEMMSDPETAMKYRNAGFLARTTRNIAHYKKTIDEIYAGVWDHVFTTGQEKSDEIDRLVLERRSIQKGRNDMMEKDERAARREKRQ